MMFVAQNIDALIAFLGGAYCTYLAFRGAPAGTAKAGEWQVWLASWGRLLKILGPILMITGLGQSPAWRLDTLCRDEGEAANQRIEPVRAARRRRQACHA